MAMRTCQDLALRPPMTNTRAEMVIAVPRPDAPVLFPTWSTAESQSTPNAILRSVSHKEHALYP